jgi:hypothetical protein
VDLVNELLELDLPAGPLQAVLGTVTQMAKDSAGNSAATVADLEAQAAYSFAQHLATLGSMFDLIVEDWGKVQALGEKLNNPDNLQWAWNGSLTTGQLLEGMTVSLEIGLYRRLMATVHGVREWLDSETALNNDPGKYCVLEGAFCDYPWGNWPAEAYIASQTSDYDDVNGGYTYNIVWLDVLSGSFNKTEVPKLLQHLYTPVRDGGLAVDKSDVLRRWPFQRGYCFPSNQDGSNCNYGNPP